MRKVIYVAMLTVVLAGGVAWLRGSAVTAPIDVVSTKEARRVEPSVSQLPITELKLNSRVEVNQAVNTEIDSMEKTLGEADESGLDPAGLADSELGL